MTRKPKSKKLAELPASDDKKFWGDAEQYTGTVEEIKSGPKHSWRQQGNIAECQICPLTHGVILDDKHEVQEGKIVAKKPIK